MRKGQALILVLVLINVFLILVFVASDLMLSELQIQRRMDNSMRAYYAAEAGAEKAILDVKAGTYSVPLPGAWTNVAGDTNTNYKYEIRDLAPTEDFCEITSIGKNLGTVRKILVKVPKTATDVFWPTRWKEINP